MTPNISVSSVMATAVELSWTQPDLRIPLQYMISATPLPRISQILQCTGTVTVDSTPISSTLADDITVNVTNLQEFSGYTATVTILQGGSLLNPLMLGSVQFTTLSSGMCIDLLLAAAPVQIFNYCCSILCAPFRNTIVIKADELQHYVVFSKQLSK